MLAAHSESRLLAGGVSCSHCGSSCRPARVLPVATCGLPDHQKALLLHLLRDESDRSVRGPKLKHRLPSGCVGRFATVYSSAERRTRCGCRSLRRRALPAGDFELHDHHQLQLHDLEVPGTHLQFLEIMLWSVVECCGVLWCFVLLCGVVGSWCRVSRGHTCNARSICVIFGPRLFDIVFAARDT